MRTRFRAILAILVVLVIGGVFAVSRDTPPTSEESAKMASACPAVAIGGYDPVAYFEGAPAEGSANFAYEWKGQRWHFASETHRTKFMAAPDQYAPAFSGRCAFAMSLGKVVEASPTTWMVQDGTLYLQQNGVAKILFRTLPGRAAKAQANWKLLNKPAGS